MDWPAPASEFPMLRTDIAALPGCEITKNTRSTIASVPRIFLTFIQTTVRAFGTTRQGSLYRSTAANPSLSLTRGVSELMTESDRLIACVGGLAYDDAGRLLLVQRANDPGRGLWSVPGGRVEAGEDDAAALIREMREETGLRVAPGRAGRAASCAGRSPSRTTCCTVVDGPLRAGDDALDARFVDRAAMAALPLVDGLLEALTEWGALPRS